MGILLLRSSVVAEEGGGGESSSVLRFPSNVSGDDQAAPYAVIEFANPHSDGLPIWGPSGNGVTVVMKRLVRAQEGYYQHFWHSQADGFFDGSNGYWGMHPYPQSQDNTGTTHWHEIALSGQDVTTHDGGFAFSGVGHTVDYDVVERHGMIVSRAGASDKTLTYYHDLPSTANGDKVSINWTGASYGESTAPSPKITIGDSPWFASFQHERFSGDLYGIKIFAVALSEADMISEAADFSQVVTVAGAAAIWWGKNGFDSVDDLTCDFGTGRSFTRNDSSDELSVVSV